MARPIQANADPMDRRTKIQNERDLVAANRAAEAAGLGTAAGTMILGALLPHQSAAAHDRQHETPGPLAPSEREHAPMMVDDQALNAAGQHHPPAAIAAIEQNGIASQENAIAPIAPSEPLGGYSASEMSAAPESVEDSRILTHGASGSATPSLDNEGREAVTANHPFTNGSSLSATVSHMFETVSGTAADITDAIHGVASSVAQTVTASLGNLSAAITDLTHSISDPLNFNADNQFDPILNNPALNSLGNLHLTGPVNVSSESSPVASPALALLQSLSPAVLGAPAHQVASDGVMAEAFGPTNGIAEMHPSVTSFGDLAQPIHVGFAGQPLGHMIDPHDISTHGLGSILHGFV